MIGDDLVEPDYLEDLLYLEYPLIEQPAQDFNTMGVRAVCRMGAVQCPTKGPTSGHSRYIGDTSELSSDLR